MDTNIFQRKHLDELLRAYCLPLCITGVVHQQPKRGSIFFGLSYVCFRVRGSCSVADVSVCCVHRNFQTQYLAYPSQSTATETSFCFRRSSRGFHLEFGCWATGLLTTCAFCLFRTHTRNILNAHQMVESSSFVRKTIGQWLSCQLRNAKLEMTKKRRSSGST